MIFKFGDSCFSFVKFKNYSVGFSRFSVQFFWAGLVAGQQQATAACWKQQLAVSSSCCTPLQTPLQWRVLP
jgi:hypothetical protein